MPFSERRDGTRSFDGDITGTNVELETDAGSWAYVGGELDLTNGNNGGANVVGGLGTNTVSVGNARTIPRKGDRSTCPLFLVFLSHLFLSSVIGSFPVSILFILVVPDADRSSAQAIRSRGFLTFAVA